MAIGGMVVDGQGNDNHFNGKKTFAVVISIVAQSGGLIFGFDTGISGCLSLAAGRLTTAIGRRNIMVVGGCTFFAAALINGASQNISMLILGRILLGFTNQKWHLQNGVVHPGFQFFIGLGVVTANCINYGTSKLSWGWRLSHGLGKVPATAMTIGSLLISNTPSSLVERGKLERARQSLSKVCGTNNNTEVEDELADVILSCEVARAYINLF